MRNTPNPRAEKYRLLTGLMGSGPEYGNNGAFAAPFRGAVLAVIVSDGGGWDHVSVSLQGRCPTWEEMAFVKDLFFRGDETVVQFHPKRGA